MDALASVPDMQLVASFTDVQIGLSPPGGPGVGRRVRRRLSLFFLSLLGAQTASCGMLNFGLSRGLDEMD